MRFFYSLLSNDTKKNFIEYTQAIYGVFNMISFCHFKQKEVINIKDGCRYGCVTDIEFDERCGKIFCIIVPCPGRGLCFFGNEKTIKIPWDCICKIGDDIILVNVCQNESNCC